MHRLLPALLILCSGCAIHLGPGDGAWNTLVQRHRKDAQLDQYRMHYVDTGGKGQPVVMVHGYADSSYSFHENVRPLLAAGFRIIIMDLPGMGRSGIPPESYVYSVENQARQVLVLADRLGLKRFHLVGHSMGGGIALYLTWKHRHRLRSTVVIAPASFNPAGALTKLGKAKIHWLVEPFFGRWAFKMALLDVIHDDRKVDEVLVDEYARLGQKKGFVRVLMVMVAQYFSAKHRAMTQKYGSLRTPMLIFWGEHDKWLPCWRGTKLAAQIPGALYVRVPEAGHNAHMERPEVVNPFLVKFLLVHSQ